MPNSYYYNDDKLIVGLAWRDDDGNQYAPNFLSTQPDDVIESVGVEIREQDAEDQETDRLSKNAEAYEKRSLAYAAESDPLFFESQRGEATEQEWLDKVAEIKARYPVIPAE